MLSNLLDKKIINDVIIYKFIILSVSILLKRVFRKFNFSQLLHSLFAFFLFFKELTFPCNITSVLCVQSNNIETERWPLLHTHTLTHHPLSLTHFIRMHKLDSNLTYLAVTSFLSGFTLCKRRRQPLHVNKISIT